MQKEPLLSLTFIAALASMVIGLVMAFDAPRPGEAAATILQIYAVLLGAPSVLKRVLPPNEASNEDAAKRRRYVAAALRWPLRKNSLLRRLATWVLIGGVVLSIVADNIGVLPNVPAGVLAGLIVAGVLMGALGWFGAAVPKSWKEPSTPEIEVWTVRGFVHHEDAEFWSLMVAALLLLSAGALLLLTFNEIWGLQGTAR